MTQAIESFLLACTVVTSLSAVITIIVNVISKAKVPNEKQNMRLNKLDEEVDALKEVLESDNKRINALEEGNKIILRALLALIGHEINGNHIDNLKTVKKDIEEYLINKP